MDKGYPGREPGEERIVKKLYFDIDKCLACKSCELACALAHTEAKELFKSLDEMRKSWPRVKVYTVKSKDFPLNCRNCKDALCIEACMSGALNRDKKTGQVMQDDKRCVGCWMCVMVCPYGAVRPNAKTKKVVRCDLCKDLDEPSCVKACPTGAIVYVEEEELEKLAQAKKK